LQAVVEAHHIRPGKALEIGCGTGTNAIWLAGKGFEVTGLDLSMIAIAKAKVSAAGVHCQLKVGDFLVEPVAGAPIDFVYDRGCLHVFDTAEDRARFAARVGGLLAPDGIWHSLIGSTDGSPVTPVRRGEAPPRLPLPWRPTLRSSS
jgi:SAM-dependent methyltransferase